MRLNTTSKPAKPFDARKLLEPLSQDSSTSKPNQEEEEEDFMSDKFLQVSTPSTSLTYSEKRRTKPNLKSLRQREEEARREGLDRDLLAEAEIIAGGGQLPQEDENGRIMWEQLDASTAPNLETFEKKDSQGLPSAGKGTMAAMKMMLAMGYKRGQALGKQYLEEQSGRDEEEEEEEDDDDDDDGEEHKRQKRTRKEEEEETSSETDDDDQAIEKENVSKSKEEEDDEYLIGGVSTAKFGAKLPTKKSQSQIPNHGLVEPLKIDQRRLGSHKRFGIGMVPRSISEAIQKASSSTQTAGKNNHGQDTVIQDFRLRISSSHKHRHIQGLLIRARKTLQELDRYRSNLEYNPFWLDSQLWMILTGRSHEINLTDLEEKINRDPATKEAIRLLEFAFSSSELSEIAIDQQLDTRQQQAETFCQLEPKMQLDLILDRLRKEHDYCLFCGCQYDNAQDLETNCPGTEEEDHD